MCVPIAPNAGGGAQSPEADWDVLLKPHHVDCSQGSGGGCRCPGAWRVEQLPLVTLGPPTACSRLQEACCFSPTAPLPDVSSP